MTGKWDRDDIPKGGWICIGIEDLGAPRETCEMCEMQEIRYVHSMEHSRYPETLRCGCICAGHMEENVERARKRETAFRSRASRKAGWLKRRWYRDGILLRSGYRLTEEVYLNTDGYHIRIYPRLASPGVFGFTIINRDTSYRLQAKQDYPSLDAAKLRAFDAMCWLQDRGR